MAIRTDLNSLHKSTYVRQHMEVKKLKPMAVELNNPTQHTTAISHFALMIVSIRAIGKEIW